MRPTIFISFARGDAAAVRTALELRDALGAEAEVALGLAGPLAITPRARRWIERRVEEAHVFVLVIGEAWADQVSGQGEHGAARLELTQALARPRNALPILPVLLGAAAAPVAERLPDALRAIGEVAPVGGGAALGPDALRAEPTSAAVAAVRAEIDRLRREAALFGGEMIGGEWDEAALRRAEPVAVAAPEADEEALAEAALAEAAVAEEALAEEAVAEEALAEEALAEEAAEDGDAQFAKAARTDPFAPDLRRRALDWLYGQEAAQESAQGSETPPAAPTEIVARLGASAPGAEAEDEDVFGAGADRSVIGPIRSKKRIATPAAPPAPPDETITSALRRASRVSAAPVGRQRGLSHAPAILSSPAAAAERGASAAPGAVSPSGAIGVVALAMAAWRALVLGGGPKARAEAGRSGAKAPSRATPTPHAEAGDAVRASLFAPRQCAMGKSFRAQAYLHLAEQIDAVRADAAELDPSAARQSGAALAARIRRGAEVTIQVSPTDAEGRRALRIDPGRATVVWNGEPTSADVFVHVASDAPARGYGLVAVVLLDGRPVGELAFLVDIAPAEAEPASPRSLGPAAFRAPSTTRASAMGFAAAAMGAPGPQIAARARGYEKIFFSYAREDADRVQLVARGFDLMDQDFFWDVESLRAGEIWPERLKAEIGRADVFMLFWSAAARQSQMVRSELAFALQHEARTGAPRIVPFPLEGPPPPKPWGEIADRHIGDAIYYRTVAAAERAVARR